MECDNWRRGVDWMLARKEGGGNGGGWLVLAIVVEGITEI